jgi:prepilin-type N-terminal cleavage/methylation domain-containing protein
MRCAVHKPAPHHRRTAHAPRRGFTVVEVLVALLVVGVGLLGVAGASAIAVRASGAALRERAALTGASSRLALLQSGGCANAASGEQSVAPGVAERWTVGTRVQGIRMVDVTAEWIDTGRRRALFLQGALLC